MYHFVCIAPNGKHFDACVQCHRRPHLKICPDKHFAVIRSRALLTTDNMIELEPLLDTETHHTAADTVIESDQEELEDYDTRAYVLVPFSERIHSAHQCGHWQ